MSPGLEVAVVLVIFLGLLAAGMTIPFAIGVPAIVYLLLHGGVPALKGIGLMSWGSMNSFALTAIVIGSSNPGGSAFAWPPSRRLPPRARCARPTARTWTTRTLARGAVALMLALGFFIAIGPTASASVKFVTGAMNGELRYGFTCDPLEDQLYAMR